MSKKLHEMTLPELQAERLAAVDAGDAERAVLVDHHIIALWSRRA